MQKHTKKRKRATERTLLGLPYGGRDNELLRSVPIHHMPHRCKDRAPNPTITAVNFQGTLMVPATDDEIDYAILRALMPRVDCLNHLDAGSCHNRQVCTLPVLGRARFTGCSKRQIKVRHASRCATTRQPPIQVIR